MMGVKQRTERVYDAIGLGLEARQATDPLASVTQRAYPLNFVWTVERWKEEVPDCVCGPRRYIGGEAVLLID